MRSFSEVISDPHMAIQQVLLLAQQGLQSLELAHIDLAGML